MHWRAFWDSASSLEKEPERSPQTNATTSSRQSTGLGFLFALWDSGSLEDTIYHLLHNLLYTIYYLLCDYMVYYTLLYSTLLYSTLLHYTILHYTILYYTILYYTILYYTILYYTILYYTILYYTILYYTILYYTTLHYTILYYTILYYTILYYTILYYTILYYTILYYTGLLPFSTRLLRGREEEQREPVRFELHPEACSWALPRKPLGSL